MGHLRALQIFNIVFAVLAVAVALLFVLLWCIGGIIAIREGHPIGWVFLVGGAVVAALLGGLAVLHGKAAAGVAVGRRRVLQSALAVLHLVNFPVGTAFAVYSLWVCWWSDQTKLYFDTHDSRLV
jgi:hypothetical protein